MKKVVVGILDFEIVTESDVRGGRGLSESDKRGGGGSEVVFS